ncbi:PREDICTED: homeobox-leucine zipper protein ATHB-12-like [Ipomoea nil]|uniref:homeobox-leucine zipper protein ATHB-12-like n=1 Tax=Ipomoea nil TaxID=35883 RepID=UPI000900F190|nr:PREDICTED: homeobox-leucine zipper protein ATHB-12-like [Ipomoea nil]
MEEEEEEHQASETHESVGFQKGSKKKKSKNSKRFSNEQVKSLETIFKLETKLETKKKLQVARDLGLQPRQVAIWFQNKRARWKSKQIEEDYRVLKAKFDNLNVQFDNLKKEKDSLLIQSEKLRSELETKDMEMGSGSHNKDTNYESKESVNGGRSIVRVEEDEEKDKALLAEKFKQKEEAEFLNLGELGGSPLASPEQWCSGSLNIPFDQSCGTPKWWDF